VQYSTPPGESNVKLMTVCVAIDSPKVTAVVNGDIIHVFKVELVMLQENVHVLCVTPHFNLHNNKSFSPE